MLNVTRAACKYLGNVIDKAHVPEGTAVRIVPKGEKYGTTFDVPQKGDAMVEDQGRVVLLLDPGVSDRLAERTLDVEPKGQALTLS